MGTHSAESKAGGQDAASASFRGTINCWQAGGLNAVFKAGYFRIWPCRQSTPNSKFHLVESTLELILVFWCQFRSHMFFYHNEISERIHVLGDSFNTSFSLQYDLYLDLSFWLYTTKHKAISYRLCTVNLVPCVFKSQTLCLILPVFHMWYSAWILKWAVCEVTKGNDVSSKSVRVFAAVFLSPSKYLLRSESMRFSRELQANRFARAYEHRAKWVIFWTSIKVFTEGLKRDLKVPLKLFVWASQLKLLYSKTAARHLILPCSQIAAFPERGKTVQSCECCCSKNVNITLSYWLYEVTAKWNAIKRWLHLGGVWLISWRS